MIDDLIGTSVSVHLNLTKGSWVIARKPKSRALAYADQVTLSDVTFKVSEAQRRYCIAHNGRWVHAWALGTLEGIAAVDTTDLLEVTYNPWKAPTFHVAGMEWPVTAAKQVHFTNKHGYLAREDIKT